MARPLRIEYEGAYYHVLSRGNKQQAIFLSDQDRYTFLKTLGRMSERFEVDIIAFVLMDNHLLLRTNRPNLSKSMQWLGTTYTTIFNLSHSQKGHLFQGRFKSILVENEPYLLQLSYYIHRNPLRAGIVQRLIDYPWSSYPAYAYNRRRPDWLKTDLILSQFDPDRNRHKAYREKVQQYADEKKSIQVKYEKFKSIIKV
jgi:REP element-mobilizing transposase RayT